MKTHAYRACLLYTELLNMTRVLYFLVTIINVYKRDKFIHSYVFVKHDNTLILQFDCNESPVEYIIYK